MFSDKVATTFFLFKWVFFGLKALFLALLNLFIALYIPFSAPLLELAQDKDVRQLLEVGRQLFTNSNITVRSISVLITSGIFDHVIVGWYV